MHQPDFIFKSSVLLAWGIGCCLIYIQIVTNNFSCPVCIVVDLITFLFLTSLLCISWYKKLCWWKSGRYAFKMHGEYSCMVFHLFEKIQHSVTLRIGTYLLIIISYYAVISLIMVSLNHLPSRTSHVLLAICSFVPINDKISKTIKDSKLGLGMKILEIYAQCKFVSAGSNLKPAKAHDAKT